MIETADLFEGRNAEAEGRPPFTKEGRPPPSSSTGECVMARTVWRATSLATRWALLLSVRRKPEIMRANAIGRGRFANHSETKRFHGDGSYPSPIRRAPASDAATASAWGGGLWSAGKPGRPASWHRLARVESRCAARVGRHREMKNGTLGQVSGYP